MRDMSRYFLTQSRSRSRPSAADSHADGRIYIPSSCAQTSFVFSDMKNKVHFADTGKIIISLRTKLIALVACVRVFQNLSAVEERPRRTADERAAMRNLNFPSPPSMSADIQEINQASDLGTLAKDERSAMRNLQFPSVPPTSPETCNPSSTSAIGITASSRDGRNPADIRETLRNAFQGRLSGSPMLVSDVRL